MHHRKDVSSQTFSLKGFFFFFSRMLNGTRSEFPSRGMPAKDFYPVSVLESDVQSRLVLSVWITALGAFLKSLSVGEGEEKGGQLWGGRGRVTEGRMDV